jgi:ADP-ribose pyrophosphatase YjhB (NUDIX family)
MVWKPDVTVAAVIERAGRFLLVEERIRGQLVLNQPAGHLEDGEALVDAVVRETLEETAWQFTPESLLGIYQWRSPRGHTTLRVAFTGSVQGYDPARPLDAPIVTTHWLAREEIAQRSARLRTPLVLKCIEDYLAGRRLPLDALNAQSSAPTVSLKVPSLKVPRAT